MRSILPFLSDKEVLQMQCCGKFFYYIAVSRVQVKLCLPIEHYFVGSSVFKHSIFRINSKATGVEFITDTGFDFFLCRGSVLLNSELYCYFDDGDFTKISNLNSSRTQ